MNTSILLCNSCGKATATAAARTTCRFCLHPIGIRKLARFHVNILYRCRSQRAARRFAQQYNL